MRNAMAQTTADRLEAKSRGDDPSYIFQSGTRFAKVVNEEKLAIEQLEEELSGL